MADKTKKKLKKKGVAIAVLCIMLTVTTLALILSFVGVEDNKFLSGNVEIEVNDGKTVFSEQDSLLEPERTLIKKFTIENKGSADVYYRLYLENIQGDLRKALNFKIYDGDELLFDGSAIDLSKENPCISDKKLLKGEIRTLVTLVKMNGDINSNNYQTKNMKFDITVDAVQSKNNPNRAFE